MFKRPKSKINKLNRNKAFSIIEFCHEPTRPQKIEGKNKIVYDVIKDYISETSLHGIKYFGQSGSSVAEKMCWIIGWIISILTCIYFIYNIWVKWNTSPVILTFNKEQTPICDIPFPAVTICPSDKINQHTYNFTRQYKFQKHLQGSDKKKYMDISLICGTGIGYGDEDYTDESIVSNIKSLDEVKENVGWTLENGYPKRTSFDEHPRRTSGDGFVSGLTISIFTDLTSRDNICSNLFSGFKIILHNPAEPARPGQEYILASSDQELAIIVKPEMTITESTLISMHPKIRKCFFSHERSLKFFNVYTSNNCKIECLANVTLGRCECVPFYMPREKGTKICANGKTKCIIEINRIINKYKLQDENSIDPDDDFDADIFFKCNCLPPCSSLSFSAETSQSKLRVMDTLHTIDLITSPENITYDDPIYKQLEFAEINIFFKEEQFLALHRNELYGATDFFANIGGLLGLFMGFSVLSLLEIIYFLTIHMWCRLNNDNN